MSRLLNCATIAAPLSPFENSQNLEMSAPQHIGESPSNALSVLYPKGSDEKRLLDAMLLAVPR